jgi:proteasome accessory factor A
VLDQVYGSLALDEGLYWQYERDGLVDRVVSEDLIERFVHTPPENTRAYTRSMLLQRGAEDVDRVDWDEVRFRWRYGTYSNRIRTVRLANPLRFTRNDTADLFRSHESLEDLLDALGATDELRDARTSTQGWSSGAVTVWRGWTHDQTS